MAAIINVDVVGNSVRNATKINLDERPLGMMYPMTSPSQRQFAYNKYYRWFWNSVNLNSDNVMKPLNDIVDQAIHDKRIVIGSEFHNLHSHVDVVLGYIDSELQKRGFEVAMHRGSVQL